jgi:CBS domain-containing protein
MAAGSPQDLVSDCEEHGMLEAAAYTAGDLMTRDVAVVHPETSLREAVTIMARRGISGMPVVDATGAVVGMLSEGDLVRWQEGQSAKQARWLDMLADGFALAPAFIEGLRSEANKVKTVMVQEVTAVDEATPARRIARLMHAKGIKRVPVLRDGKLVGIVARSDLVRALAEELAAAAGEPAAAPASVDEALRRGREEAIGRR